MPLDARFDTVAWHGPDRDLQGAALSLDGVKLSEMGLWVSDARLGAAPVLDAVSDMPGRMGGIDQTLLSATGAAYASRRRCEFDVATDAPAHLRARPKIALGAYHGREVEFVYAPMGLAMRGRVAVGAWTDSGALSSCTVAIDANPIAHGPVRTAGASGTVVVGGNAEAWPTFTLRAGTDCKSARIDIDGANAVEVMPASGPSFPEGAVVVVDFERARAEVNGSIAVPTLASDFPPLAPGAHKLSCAPSGTVAWRDAYMF